VSVDTHLKGKNLSPYRTLRQDGVKILLPPKLFGFADEIDLSLRGRVRRKLVADIFRAPEQSCG
jgi:hypothetical protein